MVRVCRGEACHARYDLGVCDGGRGTPGTNKPRPYSHGGRGKPRPYSLQKNGCLRLEAAVVKLLVCAFEGQLTQRWRRRQQPFASC